MMYCTDLRQILRDLAISFCDIPSLENSITKLRFSTEIRGILEYNKWLNAPQQISKLFYTGERYSARNALLKKMIG